MSIASELNALNGHIISAYDEIDTMGGTIPQNKNMANLASAISSIPTGGGGGGGVPALWLGGKNPVLQKTITMTFNLADDTTYLSKTPTTSSQSILSGGSASYTQTYECDIENYDWLAVYDALVPHIYTQTPTTAYAMCYASSKYAYYIGRMWDGIESSNVNFYNLSSQFQISGNILRYRYGSNVYIGRGGDASTGVYATPPSSVGNISSTSNIITLSIRNPDIYIKTNSSRMNASSWQYLDASATNVYFRCQIFRIDKDGGVISMASNMLHDACVSADGSMASNEIIWGA